MVMKPNFALSLSMDGIALLHRALPGWHLVGEVAPDSTDLAAELAELRGKARTLDPTGLHSKLVIPDDQIRYLDIDAGDATGDGLARKVRAALDGATPYAVEDLVYDWTVAANRVHIAAVARETLDEAESFAEEHAFNPVSFVARPETGGFVGEPFFGRSNTAVARGEDVTRDAATIRIMGAAHMPDARPEPAPDAETPAGEAPKDAGNAQDVAKAAPVAPVAPEKRPAAPVPRAQKAADASSGRDDSPEGGPAAEPAVTFASIRARRDNAPGIAVPLSGADRGAPDARPDAHITASLRPTPEDGGAGASAPAPPEAAAALTGTGPTGVAVSADTARPGPAADAVQDMDETRRMTIFGARDTGPVRGKPRYLGLILTIILLLFLVAVAALASVLGDEGLARLWRGSPTELADTPRPGSGPNPAAQPQADPGTEPKTAAMSAPAHQPTNSARTDSTAPRTFPIPPQAPDAVSQDQRTARPDIQAARPTPEAPVPRPVPRPPAALPPEAPGPPAGTGDPAGTRYAVTGIWQKAPAPPNLPAQISLDTVYQTSIDVGVTLQDAVALPDEAGLRPDPGLRPPAVPAAPGTTFDMDDRGLVRATPGGALTPQGIVVQAGPPPVVPPARPVQEVRPATTLDPAVVESLSQVRPRPRPDDLSEQNQRGSLGGRTRTELAALRPSPRPDDLLRAAAAPADAAAIAAAVDTAARPESDPLAAALPQAVDRSLKPATRPRELVTRAAAASRTATTNRTSQATQAPRIPSSTTVAKAATQRDVLDMRNASLIGVYGAPGSRRALVRLASGRYQKVKVGDRLDGGQVAAIGDSELRYVKRGQNVVLRLPRG